MAISKDDILSAIEEMSVMDLVELISAIEEKFGVTAAAAVAAAPAATGGDCNVQPSGAWNAKTENITTLEQCVAKAKACKMANFVSFSNVPGNSDCSWYQSCNTGQLCENCHTCGIGCPKYYP